MFIKLNRPVNRKTPLCLWENGAETQVALVQWTRASVRHGTRGNARGCRVKNGAVTFQTVLRSDQLRPPSPPLPLIDWNPKRRAQTELSFSMNSWLGVMAVRCSFKGVSGQRGCCGVVPCSPFSCYCPESVGKVCRVSPVFQIHNSPDCVWLSHLVVFRSAQMVGALSVPVRDRFYIFVVGVDKLCSWDSVRVQFLVQQASPADSSCFKSQSRPSKCLT